MPLNFLLLTVIFIFLISFHCTQGYKVKLLYNSHELIPRIRTTNMNYIFNSGRYIFTENSDKKSKIYNVTDMACFSSKELCLVSGNRHIELYKVSQNSISRIRTFSYKKTKRTLISLMKISVIPNTDFFLSGEFVKDGIMRWNLNNNANFAKMKLQKIPKFLSLTAIIALRHTRFSVVTFRTYKVMLIFDFIKMEKIQKFKNFFGYPTYIDFQPSKSLLALAEENRIRLANYQTGKSQRLISTDYYINSITSIPKSAFVITAGGDFLRIYDILDPGSENFIFSYNSKKSLYCVDYNEVNKRIFFSGNSIAGYLSFGNYSSKAQSYCHPYCHSCETLFSRFGCEDCSILTQKVNAGCDLKERDIPQGGFFEKYDGWSLEGYEGFVEGVTWRVLVYVIIVILLVIVLLIFVYFGYVYLCFRGRKGRRYRGVSKESSRK